jgi:hypothetical protein
MVDATGGRSPQLLLTILRLRDEANGLSRGLVGRDHLLFPETSLDTPPLSPAELGFLRVVAWLYVHYYEVGLVGTRFLSGLFDPYQITRPEALRLHMRRVAQLRTYMQHNLDPGKPRDREIQAESERWFQEACGSQVPAGEGQWERCLEALLEEAHEFLGGCVATIRGIEQDEGRDEVVEQWIFRAKRHHTPDAFDRIVSEVATDLGREHLDVVRFRKRFYDRWIEALDLLDGDYNFAMEGRRVVESSLLTEAVPVLPITGTEVMAEFGLQPGPHVGHVLERARSLFGEAPCDGNELLARLRPFVEGLSQM